MTGINTCFSIVTHTVNGFNAPSKRHRLADWIKNNNKKDTIMYYLQEIHLACKDIHRLKMKGCKIILQAAEAQKQAGVTLYISDKVDFKLKLENTSKVTIYW